MNTVQETEQRRVYSDPRDFAEDVAAKKEVTWNVCGECLRVFLGEQRRIQCHVCAERRTI